MTAPSEHSDQPGHSPSLIRVFAVRMKKAWVLSYPLSAQRRLWSDWADAQADLRLHWTLTHFVGFVMSQLMCASCIHMCFISESNLCTTISIFKFESVLDQSFKITNALTPTKKSWTRLLPCLHCLEIKPVHHLSCQHSVLGISHGTHAYVLFPREQSVFCHTKFQTCVCPWSELQDHKYHKD